MRLLDRYLLRELLVPLGFCLCGFLIFFITFDALSSLDDFQTHKLRGLDVAEYYVVKTPELLVTVLPVALLLAMLYTLTNHARHHELTAIRGAGVGLWRMSVPYLAVGLLASAALFALNELWVPNADDAADVILNRRLQKPVIPRNPTVVFVNARDGRIWHMESYNGKTGEMTHPNVLWQLPDGSHRELFAKRAVWTNDAWTFFDLREDTYAPGTGALTNQTKAAVQPMPAFKETPQMVQTEIKISERLSRRRTKSADIPLVELADYLRVRTDLGRSDKAWLYTKLDGRLAAPWTCLVVVLIAIPFGAASGRRSVFVGVASSVVICFAYFVLLQLGLALGAGGYVPPWLGAWAPNLAVGGAGVWLARRVQ